MTDCLTASQKRDRELWMAMYRAGADPDTLAEYARQMGVSMDAEDIADMREFAEQLAALLR